MNIRAKDAAWMRRALELARRGIGRTSPNPPVGAVVVKNGRIVGSGYHKKAGGPHAEVFALRQAGRKAHGAALYVTLEPCSSWGRTGPCTEAILKAGIRRVVFAIKDPNPRNGGKGMARLRKAGVSVSMGVESDAARELIAPFAKLVQTGKPWLILKMAMSLDGRITDAAGKSHWITSEASRKLVHRQRGLVDAIMIGSGTALADNPSLLPDRGGVPPWRVIVNTSADIPAGSRLLTDEYAHRTVIAVACNTPRRRLANLGKKALVLTCPKGQGGVNMPFLLKKLGKLGVLQVFCEGGSRLAASLLKHNLVDELWIFNAPFVLGDGKKACPGFRGYSWTLAGTPKYRFVDVKKTGDDVFMRLIRRDA